MIVFSALAFACDTDSVEPLNTGEDDDDVVIMSDPNDWCLRFIPLDCHSGLIINDGKTTYIKWFFYF